MKKTKKIFSALMLALIIILSTSVIAFAEGGDGAAEVGAQSAFEAIYSFIELHASELLSALAFASSLAVALCYKRGVLPALSRAVGSIGKAIGTMSEKTDKEISDVSEAATNMLSKLGLTEQSLAAAAAKLDELSSKLADAKKTESELHSLRTVMSVQIDVLYDIFMASSLPQYRKDAIGEQVSKMKKSLEAQDYEESAS